MVTYHLVPFTPGPHVNANDIPPEEVQALLAGVIDARLRSRGLTPVETPDADVVVGGRVLRACGARESDKQAAKAMALLNKSAVNALGGVFSHLPLMHFVLYRRDTPLDKYRDARPTDVELRVDITYAHTGGTVNFPLDYLEAIHAHSAEQALLDFAARIADEVIRTYPKDAPPLPPRPRRVSTRPAWRPSYLLVQGVIVAALLILLMGATPLPASPGQHFIGVLLMWPALMAAALVAAPASVLVGKTLSGLFRAPNLQAPGARRVALVVIALALGALAVWLMWDACQGRPVPPTS